MDKLFFKEDTNKATIKFIIGLALAAKVTPKAFAKKLDEEKMTAYAQKLHDALLAEDKPKTVKTKKAKKTTPRKKKSV